MNFYRLLSMATIVLLVGAFAYAQEGAVTGTVTLSDGNPAVEAFVSLSGHSGGHHHGGYFARTTTDETGAFTFDPVPVDVYTIMARMRMQRPDTEVIEVLEGQTTHINLVLEPMFHDSGGHDGEHHGDSLTTIELTGFAVVEEPNDSHDIEWYFLDVDDDGVSDYRLNFGPPWYNPDNGNVRPEDGDPITVTGGLMGDAEPPMVIVWDLNGEFWREPFRGHGGHGGGWHHDHGCPGEPTGIELFGIAQVVERPDAPHGDMVMYFINTDDDPEPNYILDFGAPDYDPGNGATRPEDGEEITIVGGLIDCPHNPIDFVIVYEINGMFWRVPGDTSGLGPLVLSAPEDHSNVVTVNSLSVSKNYPNPFNPETSIEFTTPIAGPARVVVHDITGREVATLFSGNVTAGHHTVQWNGANSPSGIYFYTVAVGNQSVTQRMLLLK